MISLVENTGKERREHVFYKESVKFYLKILLKDMGWRWDCAMNSKMVTGSEAPLV